jgi:hypothetical protein
MVDSDTSEFNFWVGWIEDEDCGGEEEDSGGENEAEAVAVVAGMGTVRGKKNDDVLVWVRIGIRIGIRNGVRVGGKG